MSHSILAPSSAARWVHCPGSVLASMMYPATAGNEQDRREGVAVHDLAATLIKCQCARPTPGAVVGTSASNGVVYTLEMYQNAELYADDVLGVMRETGIFGGPHCGTEERVDCHTVHPDAYGTVDQYIDAVQYRSLYIWDYKNGRRPVSATENWQMIMYASGLIDRWADAGARDQATRVHIRVVQPRQYTKPIIDEWVVRASDLRPYINRLSDAADLIMGGNPGCRAGRWCRKCRARFDCETALSTGLEQFDAVGSFTPLDLQPSELGAAYMAVSDAAALLESLRVGLDEHITGLISSGTPVNGLELRESRGSVVWTHEPTEMLELGSAMGVDLSGSKPSICTPKQAISAGVPKSMVELYSKHVPGKRSLKPADPNRGRKLFGGD